MKAIIIFLAQGLGSGKVRYAPGTFGTLAGILVFYVAIYPLDIYLQIALIVVSSIFGIWLTASASRFLQKEDPASIVWDEWVGVWICLLLLPPTWVWYLTAFIIFRILDIWKPLFIGYLDKKLTGGLGIMADDIAAGILTFAILQAIIYACNIF